MDQFIRCFGELSPPAPSLEKRRGEVVLWGGFRTHLRLTNFISLLKRWAVGVQYLLNLRQYATKIMLDLFVAESDDLNSHFADDECSEFIMVLPIVMNLAIDLHHQLPFIAKEISDKESFLAQISEENWVLAIEF